jgi:hypothetical protein
LCTSDFFDAPRSAVWLHLPAEHRWAAIDISSVFPWMFFVTLFTGDDGDSAASQKSIKIIRLLRLAKLLRMFRAMRMFKKYEEQLGPMLQALLLIGTISLLLHFVTCLWFLVGTMPDLGGEDPAKDWKATSTGWIEEEFQSSKRMCDSCYNETKYVYDAFLDRCLSTEDESLPALAPCEDEASPTKTAYYIKSFFTVFQTPEINDEYEMTVREMMFGMLATVVMGSIWGAVAGTFSSIFGANQMASQAYRMKIMQLREFCRVKGLAHGAREKLEAHYTHLYPDKLIVDESDVINDLPPQMREELVSQLYGRQLFQVPLFLNLELPIMTELCVALRPLPALRGATIVREGTKATHMFCISAGNVRVTEKASDGDDVQRIGKWIEELFAHAGRHVVLFEPNRRQQIDMLVKRIKRITKDKERNRKKMELNMNEMNERLAKYIGVSAASKGLSPVAFEDPTFGSITGYDTTVRANPALFVASSIDRLAARARVATDRPLLTCCVCVGGVQMMTRSGRRCAGCLRHDSESLTQHVSTIRFYYLINPMTSLLSCTG